MRRRTTAAGAALTLALAASATEVALPSLAENRVRDKLADYGSVSSVQLSTAPAVRMLFGSVERARIRMSTATVDTSVLPEMLARAGAVDVVDARIDTLHVGPLDVGSVVLNKVGQALDASATVDVDQIERLVPGAQLKVEDGKMLLELSRLPLPLPLPGPIQIQIAAENGQVVARPLGTAAALLPTQPLLERPELSVTGLQSELTDGQLTLTADATLDV